MEKEKVIRYSDYVVDSLTMLFVGLKLTGYIDWNWFLVLSPTLFWLGLILIVHTEFKVSISRNPKNEDDKCKDNFESIDNNI